MENDFRYMEEIIHIHHTELEDLTLINSPKCSVKMKTGKELIS
jgi:hypothetical protein